MSAAWILFGAQQGVNLLGSLSSLGTSRAAAAAARGQAQTFGALERFQIARVGREDAVDRQNRLASALGSQRAALGAAGVSGGRTAQLLEARSLLNAQQDQTRANLRNLTATQASLVREQGAVRGASAVSSQAGLQFGADIFGQLVSAQQGYNLLTEQDRALR